MNHASYVTPVLWDAIPLEDLTDVFTPVNTPLPAPCFYLKIQNLSNYAIFISFDGVEYHDYLPSRATINLKYDTVINRQRLVYPTWPQGQIVYASVANFPFVDPPAGVVAVSAFTSFTEKGT